MIRTRLILFIRISLFHVVAVVVHVLVMISIGTIDILWLFLMMMCRWLLLRRLCRNWRAILVLRIVTIVVALFGLADRRVPNGSLVFVFADVLRWNLTDVMLLLLLVLESVENGHQLLNGPLKVARRQRLWQQMGLLQFVQHVIVVGLLVVVGRRRGLGFVMVRRAGRYLWMGIDVGLACRVLMVIVLTNCVMGMVLLRMWTQMGDLCEVLMHDGWWGGGRWSCDWFSVRRMVVRNVLWFKRIRMWSCLKTFLERSWRSNDGRRFCVMFDLRGKPASVWVPVKVHWHLAAVSVIRIKVQTVVVLVEVGRFEDGRR